MAPWSSERNDSGFGQKQLPERCLAGPQAPALIVIHKCWRPVISAGMPKSSVQACPEFVEGDGKLGATTEVPATSHMKLLVGMLAESSICTTDLLPSMAWFSASLPK